MLAFADWRSSVLVLAAFAAIVLWEAVRQLKAARPVARTPVEARPTALPTPRMTPVRDA
jgi:hypothetical protein